MILLNDNGRSYDPTAGGFAASLLAGSARQLFEALGLAYIGEVDGHDVHAVENALWEAKSLGRPVVVHCKTVKGKGYTAAETDEADRMHAVGASGASSGRTWTDAFSDEIVAIGSERPDVVRLTAAMLEPVGLRPFSERFPARVFDVGIAEQHAVTSAAGMAMGGLHPVVAVYATFLSRAFDQLLMDVALHRLPVTFVLDRAGVTGPDGASHHGMWDASVLPVVPGLRLAAPRDPASLGSLLREAVEVSDGPTVVRYPKAAVGPDVPAVRRVSHFDVLRARCGRRGAPDRGRPAGRSLSGRGGGTRLARRPRRRRGPALDRAPGPGHAAVKHSGQYRLVLAVEDTTSTGSTGRTAGSGADRHPDLRGDVRAATTLPAARRRARILRAHGLDAAGITTSVLKRLGVK